MVGRRDDGEIGVRVTSPPVEGAANKHLVKFLAKTLGVSASHLELLSGEKGRSKLLRVEGLSLAEAEAALGLADED